MRWGEGVFLDENKRNMSVPFPFAGFEKKKTRLFKRRTSSKLHFNLLGNFQKLAFYSLQTLSELGEEIEGAKQLKFEI